MLIHSFSVYNLINNMTDKYKVVIKWNGQNYPLEISPDMTVKDLKLLIEGETKVRSDRQKLLNLKFKGKPAEENAVLTDLKVKPNMKIMMMGTTEENLEEVLGPPPDVGEVINDFDIGDEEEIKLEHMEEHLAKIERRVQTYEVKKINDPREGKKLLVLDVDYTLFDHRSNAEKADELMRPYLHEFLTRAYVNYDIVIWSATSMKWIEVKMKELGVTSNQNYKIAFFMDHGAMITVHTPSYGVIDTKPLGVIWGKYPEFYSAKNTIMFDDLRRNFLMNPQSGLKIRPFKNAHQSRTTDVELQGLSQYLEDISHLDSFKELKHRKWERAGFKAQRCY
uniref:ubiquitin-like domain-containing CTD phosphatase 1 isoform X1 n=1 Tax=Ciona intestinalis TaxID=7719 RepID=UPI000EF4CC96|nr:ubiquitin-like domain-containing CTD phosphatase 1 isoform X1 [Ciona intestinalis]|eukprot:XP_026691246.1 ubiquitin-like domain-containing CTD phosphatase 1 isoform X1 [Ciona intestinalis]